MNIFVLFCLFLRTHRIIISFLFLLSLLFFFLLFFFFFFASAVNVDNLYRIFHLYIFVWKNFSLWWNVFCLLDLLRYITCSIFFKCYIFRNMGGFLLFFFPVLLFFISSLHFQKIIVSATSVPFVLFI